MLRDIKSGDRGGHFTPPQFRPIFLGGRTSQSGIGGGGGKLAIFSTTEHGPAKQRCLRSSCEALPGHQKGGVQDTRAYLAFLGPYANFSDAISRAHNIRGHSSLNCLKWTWFFKLSCLLKQFLFLEFSRIRSDSPK